MSSQARPLAGAFALLAVSGILAAVVPTLASDHGVSPPAGCTCHSDNPTVAVVPTVAGWPAIYTPDTLYAFRLTATGDVPGTHGGFAAEVSKGFLSSSDPHVSASGRTATHTGSDNRAWDLSWLAPPEDSGNVTITVYVNLVNGDGSEGPDDHWNTATFTAVEKAPEPPKPSALTLTFSAEGPALIAGANITVVAHLTNVSGAPIPNAAVAFLGHSRFGLLPLGEDRTDPNGTASMNWTPVAEGDYEFEARYAGSSKNLSTNATGVASVADPNHVFESLYGRPTVAQSGIFDPVRVPLGLIVGGVWLTFAFAGLQVLRVRKQGAPTDDGPRGLIRILIPKMGTTGRKKP